MSEAKENAPRGKPVMSVDETADARLLPTVALGALLKHLTLALAATAMFASAAGAQTGVAVTYDLADVDWMETMMNGVAVHVDTPVWGFDRGSITIAGSAAFNRASETYVEEFYPFDSVQENTHRFYAGVGPGVRLRANDRVSFFGHLLFGMLRESISSDVETSDAFGLSHIGANDNSIKGRAGGGVDYRLGDSWSLRAGIDYDGAAHALAGVSTRF